MVYLCNALVFAWVSSFWSKTGIANILIAFGFATLAVINAIGAALENWRGRW